VKLLPIIFLATALSAGNLPPDTGSYFARGCQQFSAGEFPDAAQLFYKSAEISPAVGTLLNLGLAEWRRGRAGAAILAWERAGWMDPFDTRVTADLKFARETARVDAPQLKWFETASTWLPPDAWAWLAAGSLWFGVALLMLPGIIRRRVAGWQQTLAALSFGIFLFSLAANAGVISRGQIGFVLKRNALLTLTPTREGEVVATLAAGEPARKVRARGDFVFVRATAGSGWIERTAFQQICER